MIYLTLGEAIRQGVPLYKEIHDNKPPFLYILASLAGSLFWFKAILAIWHLISVFLFWKLSSALFPKNIKLQRIATATFALLTTLPMLEGNIVNAELFMIGPIIAGFLLILNNKANSSKIFLAGILFSSSVLFKIPAIFDSLTVPFFWLVVSKNIKDIRQILRKTFFLLTGLFTPLALTLIWYYLSGAAKEYVVAAFLQNVGYLATWRPGDVTKPFFIKNAPLLFRAGILALGFGILYWKKNKLSREFMFSTGWLLLTLFATTLSERPYPHYLIQVVPPFSLTFAMLVSLKTFEQVLTIIPLTLTFLVPVYFKYWHYPSIPYYVRFINFATGRTEKSVYLSSFGGNVTRNYKIADFLAFSTKRGDSVFIWGDGVPIYALSRRLPPIKYVADYHISDFSSKGEVIKNLNKKPPKIVVILPGSEQFIELNSLLKKNYILVETIERAEIWSLLSPRLKALLAL